MSWITHSKCNIHIEYPVLHTCTVVFIFRKGKSIKTGAVESTRKVIAILMTTTIVDNTFIHIYRMTIASRIYLTLSVMSCMLSKHYLLPSSHANPLQPSLQSQRSVVKLHIPLTHGGWHIPICAIVSLRSISNKFQSYDTNSNYLVSSPHQSILHHTGTLQGTHKLHLHMTDYM